MLGVVSRAYSRGASGRAANYHATTYYVLLSTCWIRPTGHYLILPNTMTYDLLLFIAKYYPTTSFYCLLPLTATCYDLLLIITGTGTATTTTATMYTFACR